MAATKKLYVEIAEEIRQVLQYDLNYPGWTPKTAAAVTARRVAKALKEDNPRFRYDTFFEACGLSCDGFVMDEVTL